MGIQAGPILSAPLLVLLVVAALFALGMFFRARSGRDPTSAEEEPLPLAQMIRSVSSKGELMDIALNYRLSVESSAEFLEKALQFENELTPDNWADIYEASEEGTKLERIAEERAGDTLVPAEDADR